jgi:hypothetical protein
MNEKRGIGYLATSTWTATRRSWHACHYFTRYMILGIKDGCDPISGPAWFPVAQTRYPLHKAGWAALLFQQDLGLNDVAESRCLSTFGEPLSSNCFPGR